MSRDPFSPRRPGDFTRLVGTVADALDDLAEQLQTAGGGVTDHGALTGLGDDDHTQYLRNVTGHTSSGFILTTAATDRDVNQGGATLDGSGNLSLQSGDLIIPTGDITIGGTVDGRDVSADGAKLDGIEAGADVTDATNVEAAGAVMDGDFSSAGIMTRLASSGAYASRTLTNGDGISITNGKGTSGDPEIAVTGDVIREADFSTGMVVFTNFGAFAGRTLQGGAGIDVSDGNGQSGNPSIAVDSTVLTDSTFDGDGVLVRTKAGSYAERAITGGTGITVTNGDGVSGNPTIDADFGDTLIAEWGDPTSTSSSTFFLGRHGITNPGANNRAFYRVPFGATLTRLVLVADVTAVSGNPRLGAIIYRATSPGGTFGLLALITTAGTIVSATGTNITTDVSRSDSLSAGDCLSLAYFRSGGTSMTVGNLRAFMTMEAT